MQTHELLLLLSVCRDRHDHKKKTDNRNDHKKKTDNRNDRKNNRDIRNVILREALDSALKGPMK